MADTLIAIALIGELLAIAVVHNKDSPDHVMVNDLAFSKSGSNLLVETYSWDGFTTWDPDPRRHVRDIEHTVTSFHRESRASQILHNDKTWSDSSSRFPPDVESRFDSMAYAAHSNVLAIVDGMGRGRLLDPQTGNSDRTFGKSLRGRHLQIACSEDASFVAVADLQETTLFNIRSGGCMALDVPAGTTLLAFSDSNTLISANSRDGVKVWDVVTGNATQALCEGSDDTSFSPFVSLAASPDGNAIAIGFAAHPPRVEVWRKAEQFKKTDYLVVDKHVCAIGWMCDDRLVFVDCTEHIHLWDLKNNSLRSVRGQSDELTCVAVSLDGEFVAAGSADGDVSLFDGDTLEHLGVVYRQSRPCKMGMIVVLVCLLAITITSAALVQIRRIGRTRQTEQGRGKREDGESGRGLRDRFD